MSEITDKTIESTSTENPCNLLAGVYDWCKAAARNPGAALRQSVVAVDGFVVGGIKEIPNQLQNHLPETTIKALGGLGLGASIKALSAIPRVKPILAIGLPVIGGLSMGMTFSELRNRPNVKSAMTKVWAKNDSNSLSSAMAACEHEMGNTAFDFGLITLATGAGHRFWKPMLRAVTTNSGTATDTTSSSVEGKSNMVPKAHEPISDAELNSSRSAGIGEHTLKPIEYDEPIEASDLEPKMLEAFKAYGLIRVDGQLPSRRDLNSFLFGKPSVLNHDYSKFIGVDGRLPTFKEIQEILYWRWDFEDFNAPGGPRDPICEDYWEACRIKTLEGKGPAPEHDKEFFNELLKQFCPPLKGSKLFEPDDGLDLM